jgi:two-component system, NarL family, invasion response regulator UvrY
MKTRVLLVDDHAVVRAGYRLLLQNAPEIEVVAEADSGELGCRLFAELAPDVVVMDLTLPGMGGLEAIRRIVQREPKAKVLVFSMHEDTLFVEQALAAGARGYVTKSSPPHVLVAAVKQIAAGGQPLAGDIAQRLKSARVRGDDSPLQNLSTREFEIFCLLAEGFSSSEIAKRLSLSNKTVANYGTQLKSKLGVGTVAELARLAIRHGVIAA